MTGSRVSESLEDHFGRAWDMIIEAARHFSPSQWYEARDTRMQPSRIVYHILMGADRYSWLGDPKQFPVQRQFPLDWLESPAESFLNQEDAVHQLELAKSRSLDWVKQVGEAGLLEQKPAWPWTGKCSLGQAIYHMRHLQHHMAELNAELAQRGLPIVEWK
jgi:hypothetical protein